MIDFESYDRLENQIQVQVVADSISSITLKRITTLKIRIPRVILPELTRHRVFSFSVSSSRAKRVEKVVDEIGFEPLIWMSNHKGMQGSEILSAFKIYLAKLVWKSAKIEATLHAQILDWIGLSKQYTNRLIENFTYIDVIMTGTEWENFLAQRNHPAAMYEIQVLARRIEEELNNSIPHTLMKGEWHLPFITKDECNDDRCLQVSAARCARVSYSTTKENSIDKDLKLFRRLVDENPPHLSPLEHQARCVDIERSGNLEGFLQYRKIMESQK